MKERTRDKKVNLPKAVFVLASNYFQKCFSVKLECLVEPVNSVN